MVACSVVFSRALVTEVLSVSGFLESLQGASKHINRMKQSAKMK